MCKCPNESLGAMDRNRNKAEKLVLIFGSADPFQARSCDRGMPAKHSLCSDSCTFIVQILLLFSLKTSN